MLEREKRERREKVFPGSQRQCSLDDGACSPLFLSLSFFAFVRACDHQARFSRNRQTVPARLDRCWTQTDIYLLFRTGNVRRKEGGNGIAFPSFANKEYPAEREWWSAEGKCQTAENSMHAEIFAALFSAASAKRAVKRAATNKERDKFTRMQALHLWVEEEEICLR